MRNLAELVCDRARRRPDARFGMAGTSTPTLAMAAERALGAIGMLEDAGAGCGRRVALIGTTSDSYLTAWLALVLAGAEVALVNPAYPDELLGEMLTQLAPDAAIWIGREVSAAVAPGAVHLDDGNFDSCLARHGLGHGSEMRSSTGLGGLDEAPGLTRDGFDVAGWMHTSGTTGVPKFCEQTHEYFLRLGRFIADSMCFSEKDTVLAPLPMFHINPLGYGVIGGLTGGTEVLGLERFSASGFWPLVRDTAATVLILHAPPVEILKRATSGTDAAGHKVSRVFFADADFLEDLRCPAGLLGLRLDRGRRPVPHLGLAPGRAAGPGRGHVPLWGPGPPRGAVAGRRHGRSGRRSRLG